MARKVKIPNEILKRMAKVDLKRSIETRDPRKFYLIVCEGTKTEPNYFEALKVDLIKGSIKTVDIDIYGEGMNTLSLVDRALKLKLKVEFNCSRRVDKLWIVFDKDSFTPRSFNNAITRCRDLGPEVCCAWSNEAFELWYLLYFHFYNTPLSRDQYQSLIESNFRPFLGQDFKYEKNSKDMYAHLKEHGNIENALRNAKTLADTYSGRRDYAKQNPCTMVYTLMQDLMQFSYKP